MKVAKWQMAVIVVAGVALGSTLSVAAQESPRASGKPQQPPGHKMDGPHAAFRAELALPGKDGGPVFHVRMDRGVLKAVDGSNIVITTPEGDVTVPTSSVTKVSRDGAQATLSDLKAGDHVMTHRSDEGGSMATRHVKAISPERFAEHQATREKCKSDPAACRDKIQQHRGNKRPGGGPAGSERHGGPELDGV